MSTDSSARTALRALRTALLVSGIVSVVVGLLILIWPGRTAQVAVGIIAVYAIVAGLVYAAMGLFSRAQGTWSRVGHIVLGVLFVIAGIVALSNIAAATVSFAVFIGVFLGIVWIVEGVVALTTLGAAGTRGWTIFFAIVSILAGIVLLFSPLYVAVLWIFVGVSLLVLGVFQLVRAATLARGL
ncbi:DUF308 domain-containing protein [Microbacterium sp. 10M-3C3]|jgi:uncharacterized membrane protein HdeD (DUF308 family)|uniref:HdeD family acid-resistance protein n=1 Tax=Microbacterium sp. 10M-3C3 TaxID=2483401 RepID=UPI000F63ECD4|nr:DUF308 domain-containing protein [Microbacterium sp. 10M-3C3]